MEDESLDRVVAARVDSTARETVGLRALLEACDGRAVEGEIPPEGSYAAAFARRREVLRQAERLERTPVVAVCGTVNSGKSTAVAGFLSPAGAARVLVGELDAQGTHRFVFWLPASWRGEGPGELLREMIRTATGGEAQELDEDPAAAFAQANARRDRLAEFDIPLLAYDPRLDEHGIAFLDCPDTQRPLDDDSLEFTAARRLERLRAIAPLCSAFVVVASMQQKGGEELGKVFAALAATASAAPLYFLLNMTRTDDPAIYLPEATAALDRWNVTARVRRVYLAPFVHTAEPGAAVSPEIVSADGTRSPLARLAAELDPAELQRKQRLSRAAHLRALLESAAAVTRRSYEEDRSTAGEAGARVRLFMAMRLLDRNGHPRALAHNEAVARMAASIQRTAPWAVRAANAPTRWFNQLKGRWRLLETNPDEDKRHGWIRSRDFPAFVAGSRFLPPETDESALEAVWTQALKAVNESSKHHAPDPAGLDAESRRMWREMPLREKIVLFRNVLVAMSAFAVAGMLLPFDGGASVVLVAKANIALGGAEILGMMLGGSLVGTLMSMDWAQRMIAKFESECARPQLDVLHAALADGLGIPRLPDGEPATLQHDGHAVHTFGDPGIDPLPDLIGVLARPMIRLDESAWREMMQRTFDHATLGNPNENATSPTIAQS